MPNEFIPISEFSLEELLRLMQQLSGDAGSSDGTDEGSDGDLCLCREAGDPGWYWEDEWDEDER